MIVMMNKYSSSVLVLGFSESSYSEREGMSVDTQVVVKSGQLTPSLNAEVSFGNSNGTAKGFI